MYEDQLKSYIKAVFKYRKYNVKIRKSISVGALSPSFLSGSDLSERSTRWLPISHEKVQLIAKCNLPEDSNLIKWMIEKGIRHKNTQIHKNSFNQMKYYLNEYLIKCVFTQKSVYSFEFYCFKYASNILIAKVFSLTPSLMA
jgi:hypothetical protein